MRPIGRGAIVSLLGIVLSGLVSPAAAQSARPTALRPAPAFTAKQLTAQPRDGWITNGGNVFNQRYSPLTQINRDNVARLKPSWRVALNGSGAASKYSGQGQPLEHDGVIYMVTGADDVFAIDVETGAMLWTYLARLDDKIDSVCCGWSSRGLALGDGKVYVGQLDGKLVALDQRTGKVVWSTQAERWQDGFAITAAPLYYDGLVITGFAGGDRATRGRLKAFSARDGRSMWTFYTMPGPGEPGHETWPQDNDAWKYGGASIWQTPAVDPELGLIYFSTGNPGPDLNGNVRAGDNLYSVVDRRTRGQDGQVPLALPGGAPRPLGLRRAQSRRAVRRADRRARCARASPRSARPASRYILDRSDRQAAHRHRGAPVPQEPRQATAATQPYPDRRPIVPQEIDIAPEGFQLVNQRPDLHAVLGQARAREAARPPAAPTGRRARTIPRLISSTSVPTTASALISSDGETSFMQPTPGTRYAQGTFGRAGIRVRGIFAAVDLTTNKLAWRQQWSEMCYSGSIVTERRARVRRPQRQPVHGARQGQRQVCSGISRRMRPSTRPRARSSTRASSTSSVLAAGSLFPGTKHGDSLWLFTLDGTFRPATSGTQRKICASYERGRLVTWPTAYSYPGRFQLRGGFTASTGRSARVSVPSPS